MGDLLERIERVIENHAQGETVEHCICGWAWTPFIEDTCLDQHIARAVIGELGLRQEWGSLDDEDSGFLYDSRDELTTPHPHETIKSRWITDWKADDSQPVNQTDRTPRSAEKLGLTGDGA